MSPPVDIELIRRCGPGKASHDERERVPDLTRDDPSWRAALAEALEVELALYEVAAATAWRPAGPRASRDACQADKDDRLHPPTCL